MKTRKVYLISGGLYEDSYPVRVVSNEQAAEKFINDYLKKKYEEYLKNFEKYQKKPFDNRSLPTPHGIYLDITKDGIMKKKNPVSYDKWFESADSYIKGYYSYEELEFDDFSFP